MRARLLYCALVSIGFITSQGVAATLTVPAAYPDIQTAINASNNGDLVLVSPGTYTQNLNFGGRTVSVRSTGGPAVTKIQVAGGTAVQISGAAEISGFTITGASAAFGAGISVNGVGTLIKNNVFDNNIETAGGYGAAIGGNVSSPIIDSNIFRNNHADTQYLSGVIGFINGSSPTITNNLFVNNPTRAINLVLPSGNNPSIYNNTFVNNDVAMKLSTFSPIATRNNLLFANTIGLLTDSDSPLTFENNLVYNNITNYSGIADKTGTGGNIALDPLFVNPGDYHLAFNSPAIDVGTIIGAPNHDLDGRFRPNGAAPDIGAYETPEPTATLLLAPLVLSSWLGRRRRI